MLIFLEEHWAWNRLNVSSEFFRGLHQQLVNLALPNSIVRTNVVYIAFQQVALINPLRILLPVDRKDLFLVGIQGSSEWKFGPVFKKESYLNITKLFLVLHFLVGLLALSVDELPNVIDLDFVFLIAEAEHQGVEDVGFACAVGPNDGGEG